ncbi:MAG: phosphatidate cytidylyltransferase [Alphaproteobacteria bacterium]|nr:phosphatidate cytidylyltransferase [Alphaproteobacteria bacterium]
MDYSLYHVNEDLIEEKLQNTLKSIRKEIRRKAIHLSSLWMPCLIYLLPQHIAVCLFLFLLIGDFIFEYGYYKRCSWARKTFGSLFYKTLRNKEIADEKFHPTGSIYVLTAALICSCFFNKYAAIIGLTVMLVSDSAAALVGKTYGRIKIYKNKTLEGTLAFFFSAVLVNIILSNLHPFGMYSVIACLAATLAELFEDKIKIDDNLSIPLLTAGILSL